MRAKRYVNVSTSYKLRFADSRIQLSANNYHAKKSKGGGRAGAAFVRRRREAAEEAVQGRNEPTDCGNIVAGNVGEEANVDRNTGKRHVPLQGGRAGRVGQRWWVEGSASGANVVMNASWRVSEALGLAFRAGDAANRNVIIGRGTKSSSLSLKGQGRKPAQVTMQAERGRRGLSGCEPHWHRLRQLLNSLMAPLLLYGRDFLTMWKVARKMDRSFSRQSMIDRAWEKQQVKMMMMMMMEISAKFIG